MKYLYFDSPEISVSNSATNLYRKIWYPFFAILSSFLLSIKAESPPALIDFMCEFNKVNSYSMSEKAMVFLAFYNMHSKIDLFCTGRSVC